jgi:hypothetical protein
VSWPSVLGVDYYIYVADWSTTIGAGGNSGVFDLSITCSAPLTNDLCADAEPLACGATIVASTVGSTDVGGLDCHSGFDGIWYSFVGDGSLVTVSTDNPATDFDSYLAIAESCGGVCVASDDDGGTGVNAEIAAFQTVNGQTYYVNVSGWGATGNIEISLECGVVLPPAPANDECADAEALTVNASCIGVSGDVLNATQSLVGCGGTANDDVWYSFVAVTTEATVEVTGSADFDAVLEVFDGSCGTLNSLECMDVTFDGGVESVNLTSLVPGNTYYARVYHWYTAVAATTTFDICVYSLSVGINDDMASSLNVYPNPSNGQFVVEVNGVDADAQLTVMDVAGRQVYSEGVTMNGSFRKELNLNVAQGTYLLQIATVEGVVTRKIQIH